MTVCKNCGHKIEQTKDKQKLWLHYLNGLLQLKYKRNNEPISMCECGCINAQPSKGRHSSLERHMDYLRGNIKNYGVQRLYVESNSR
jgi:hypothetical protein